MAADRRYSGRAQRAALFVPLCSALHSVVVVVVSEYSFFFRFRRCSSTDFLEMKVGAGALRSWLPRFPSAPGRKKQGPGLIGVDLWSDRLLFRDMILPGNSCFSCDGLFCKIVDFVLWKKNFLVKDLFFIYDEIRWIIKALQLVESSEIKILIIISKFLILKFL